MPTLTVDGIDYEVPEGRTVLQAIDDLGLLMNGVEIPHYCWHPKLTIAGYCRLCQVEIEGMPKLQIACNTPVTNGMEVHTKSERVLAARARRDGVPAHQPPARLPDLRPGRRVQAAGLRLRLGRDAARTREPRRPAKKSVDLGPTIVFDQERCILCRRCVRFCREVPKTGELGVFNRGDESLLELFPGSRARQPLLDERRRHLPGRRAHHARLPLQGPRLVPDDVESVCNQLLARLQHRGVALEQQDLPLRAAPERRRERHLDVRRTAACRTRRTRTVRLAAPRVDGREASYTDGVKRAAELCARRATASARSSAWRRRSRRTRTSWRSATCSARLGAGPARFSVPRGESDEILIEAEKAPNAAGCRALGMHRVGRAARPRGARASCSATRSPPRCSAT